MAPIYSSRQVQIVLISRQWLYGYMRITFGYIKWNLAQQSASLDVQRNSHAWVYP